MNLPLWIALSVLLSFVFFRRPVWIVAVALAVWTAVPYVANVLLTGSDGGYHGATWMVVIGFGVQVLFRGDRVLRELNSRLTIYLTLTFLLLLCLAMTLSGGGSVQLFVDQIIAPVLMFVLISIGVADDPIDWTILRNVVILAALVEAILGFVQMVLQQNIFYTSYFSKEIFWTEAYFRSQATLAHPLTLGFLCAVALPLLTGVRSTILKIVLASVLLTGIISAQARFALISAAIALLVLIVRSDVRPVARVLLSAMTIGVPLFLLSTPIALPIIGRFADDGTSTTLRNAAYAWYQNHWTEFIMFGNGMGTSFGIGTRAGLQSSFESSFIGFALDFGLAIAAVYFAIQLLIVVRPRPAIVRGLGSPTSAAIAIGLALVFSSIGTDTIVGPLIWIALGLAGTSPRPSALDASTPDPLVASSKTSPPSSVNLASASARTTYNGDGFDH